MKCLAKHAKYQIPEDEWNCPECGIGTECLNDEGHTVEGLIIETTADGAHGDCSLLHDEDVVVCCQCKKDWTGKQLSKIVAKAANMVTCPTCHGKGMVKKP